MVRALLLALTCAAAASAASYGDYSAVKMPQYGGGAEYDMGRDPPPSQPSDDYHGHSPDSPASPDYKYEEEPSVETEKPAKEPDDTDRWRRPGRKQRELVRTSGSDTNMRKKYGLDDDDDDEIPKFRTNRRFAKHRSRLKSEIEDRVDDIPAPRRQSKHSRDRKELSDIDRKDYFHIGREYIPDDKNKEFDDDVKFIDDEIPKKTESRRPKSKPAKRPRGTFDDYDDDLPAERQVKGEADADPLIPRDEMRLPRPAILRKAPGQKVYPPEIPSEDEAEAKADPLQVIPGRFKLKGYNEYDDYYDMKRASNIKNRLPSLLRRTTVSTETKMNSNLLDMLIPNRRMMAPTIGIDSATSASSDVVTQSATRTTTETTTTTTPRIPQKSQAHELSLAEKSRLSILKKAQRKEGQNFRSTKKPPVLLQVTSQMPTVVMVEPPSSTVAWMRAREEEDTPMRLELVKRLMRQKIVKEAKSIHDLTDNWDDMVCDYIDMSLLKDFAVRFALANRLLVMYFQVLVFFINR